MPKGIFAKIHVLLVTWVAAKDTKTSCTEGLQNDLTDFLQLDAASLETQKLASLLSRAREDRDGRFVVVVVGTRFTV